MSLLLSWVLFPLVLAAIGAGWGALVERGAGARVDGALLLPLGLAAALVVAGTLTAFTATAPAAVPVVAVGAVAGLIFAWPGWRLGRWPLLAAVGVLLAYGAPVLLSGHATFTGFLKLDDSSTWFNVIDHVFSHSRSVASEPASTYSLVYSGDVGPAYPLGAFMLAGVARALTGIDIAWVFQPYLACCGAAVALCLFALMQPLIASPRIRALLAFAGAQSALLYGYSLWGGVKELTAAFLLALGAALAAAMLPRRPARWRELLPLAVATGALIQTLGVGAGGWVAPAVALLALAWLWSAWRSGRGLGLAPSAISFAWLGVLTAAFIVPVWLVLSEFLSADAGLFSAGNSTTEKLGNLIQPLSGWQLAGIWPVKDFRFTAPTVPSVLLIGLVVIAATAGLVAGVRRRQFGVALYVAVALIGSGVVYFSGATPWVTGKVFAISSPALLIAALAGGGMLWSMWPHHRVLGLAGALVVGILVGGVLWSNVLGYHDATLAPRDRLAELQHIGGLLAGKGPTFVNEFDPYSDRHFLRQGAPVEPAEYRPVTLQLSDGAVLTKSAEADIDSFPLSTLEPYRSIVTPRSPAESRPPSIYHLIWQGSYYQLWQRPEHPARRILRHVSLGESNTLPYCGNTQRGGADRPLCSTDPVATPQCRLVQALGHQALAENAELVAYQRPAPIVARADETAWPAAWYHNEEDHTLTPTTPGSAVTHIGVANSELYELWLDGDFARGFDVSVDGRSLGRVKDELSSFNVYVHVADVFLDAGVHRFVLTYPHADLTPGSGDNELTSLNAIALQPHNPPSELIEVGPRQAAQLCGRPLDWIEIVTSS